ncbi:MAG: hypothetical protein ACETWR_02160 [Anaerolineae bacterium]
MDAMSERQAAQRLSGRIEEMLGITRDEETAGDLLDTARQLVRLSDLFGRPDPTFEQQLTAQIEARLAERPRRRTIWRPRFAWLTAAVLVLVLAGLLTPPGRAALAEFMAIFRLDQAEVHIAGTVPVAQAYTATAEITLPGLPEAQATVVPHTCQVPAYLPQGYQLHRISTSHFDQFPAWAQPLFIDVTYRRETNEAIWELAYRQYFMSLGGGTTIGSLTFSSEEIESARRVTVNSHPAVLLTVRPASSVGQPGRVLHLVWEQDGALFTLTTTELSPDELVRIAESVVPYP